MFTKLPLYLKVWHILLFAGIITAVSCQKDGTRELPSPTVEVPTTVKSWFGRQETHFNADDNWMRNLSPDWSNVYASENATETYYEVVLDNPHKVVIGFTSDPGKVSEIQAYNDLRLFFTLNKSTGAISGYVLSILNPGGKKIDLTQLHHLKPMQHSVRMSYYSLDGNFSHGYTYTDGQCTGYLSKGRSGSGGVKGKVASANPNCYTTYETIFDYCCYGSGNDGQWFCKYEPRLKEIENCEDTGGPGGSGGGEGGSGGTPWGGGGGTSPYPREITVENGTRNCVTSIESTVAGIAGTSFAGTLLGAFTTQSNSTDVAEMIMRLAGSSDWNVKIKESVIPDDVDPVTGMTSMSNARTSATGGQVVINLNSTYLNAATDLAVARTVIHEMMHAYFVFGTNKPDDPGYARFMEMNGLLFTKEGTIAADPANTQHELIASKYVDQLAGILKDYAVARGINSSPDTNISLLQYCKDLAWGGLQNTKAYRKYAPNKSRINQNLLKEQHNQTGSSGFKGC